MDLDTIEDAARRIAGKVRRTPTVKVELAREPLAVDELWLKLECLQVTGSFKARGAINRLLTLPAETLQNGIFAASGGNHGLATARAAAMAGVPATIYLPANAAPSKIAKLKLWGATVVVVGKAVSRPDWGLGSPTAWSSACWASRLSSPRSPA